MNVVCDLVSIKFIRRKEYNFSIMPIIHTQIGYAEKLGMEGKFNFVRFSIDRNLKHESLLPGDHKPYSCLLTEQFINSVDRVENFKVRPDDIWIVGFTKTGTTWMHNIVNKFKFVTDDSEVIAEKIESQFFDKGALTDRFTESMKFFDDLPSPRIFKSHLPAFLLPKQLWTVKPKIIYTTRNPKDVALSAYHMMRNSIYPFKGTLDDYCTSFMNDTGFFMPFFDHVQGFLQIRNLDNILFTVYEDVLSNQYDAIKRINEFLGCSFTDAQLCQLIENVSFKKMREEFPSFMSPTDKSTMPDPDYK